MWSFVKEVNVEMCGDDILSQVAAVEKQCGLHPGPTKKEMAGRVDCHPESGVTPDLCQERGCVWGELGVEGPWCNFRNYTAPPQFDLSSEGLPICFQNRNIRTSALSRWQRSDWV